MTDTDNTKIRRLYSELHVILTSFFKNTIEISCSSNTLHENKHICFIWGSKECVGPTFFP